MGEGAGGPVLFGARTACLRVPVELPWLCFGVLQVSTGDVSKVM